MIEDIDRTTENYVAIGQVLAAKAPMRMNTVLGSCVALMIYESETCSGGMAHILLPGAGSGSTKYAQPAIRQLIEEVRKISGRTRLIAKVVGGSTALSAGDSDLTSRVGGNNLISVVSTLVEEGIDIEGMHTGGNRERKIMFDLETGDVIIIQGVREPGNKKIKII